MFGNKTNGTITFSYSHKDMFNDVSLVSAYMTKNLGAGMDEFIITDDEYDMYMECVKVTLPAIYESMLKLASGVPDAFKTEADIKANELEGLKRNQGKYIELSILDGGSYNENTLGLVDDTLRDCIKFGTLAEYYSICLNADLQAIARGKFSASMLQLNQRLFQLKKKAVSPIL